MAIKLDEHWESHLSTMYTIHLYTLDYLHTKYGVPYSSPHGPPNVTGLHSFFGKHACSHQGHHVLGQFSEPHLITTNLNF